MLADTPAGFVGLEPFHSNMKKGWGITDDDLAACCKKETHADFYKELQSRSPSLVEGTTHIFDKTPRYLASLSEVMTRCDCQVVISHKDPRAIVCSDFKRSKADDFDTWYDDYHTRKLRYAGRCYDQFVAHTDDPRVATVGLEDLALNSRATMERMFKHADQKFELDYAIISDARYDNVRSQTVSADIVFEFRRILTQDNQDRILKDFARFDAWIYS